MNKTVKELWDSWPIGTHFTVPGRIPFIKINDTTIIGYEDTRTNKPLRIEEVIPNPQYFFDRVVECFITPTNFSSRMEKCSCHDYYDLLGLKYEAH